MHEVHVHRRCENPTTASRVLLVVLGIIVLASCGGTTEITGRAEPLAAQATVPPQPDEAGTPAPIPEPAALPTVVLPYPTPILGGDVGDFELRVVALDRFEPAEPLQVLVQCDFEGDRLFDGALPLSPAIPLVVPDLPIGTVCVHEVVSNPSGFKVIGDLADESPTTIDSWQGSLSEFAGFTDPIPDEIVVVLFAAEGLGEVDPDVGFTATCNNGLVESFVLKIDEQYTIDGIDLGDICRVVVDEPGRFDMDSYVKETYAWDAKSPPDAEYELDDIGFELRGLTG